MVIIKPLFRKDSLLKGSSFKTTTVDDKNAISLDMQYFSHSKLTFFTKGVAGIQTQIPGDPKKITAVLGVKAGADPWGSFFGFQHLSKGCPRG